MPTHIDGSSIMSLSRSGDLQEPGHLHGRARHWSMSDEDVKNAARVPAEGRLPDPRRRPRQPLGQHRPADEQLFPEGRWVELDGTHQIFHSFFEIPHPEQIPQDYDPPPPHFLALFEDNDPNKRMMILCNYSTDISEFWEWSDTGFKPIDGQQRGLQGRHQRVHVRHHALRRTPLRKGTLWIPRPSKPFAWIRPRTSRSPTR